ncbi:MAG: D-2-hydroxyacid dehydrogenase [Clostridiales Family XIII bacterium]|jgi:glycerate dehydrogenase|nr:D-2-hydroxyacid dehydrogenase [Clostridiales Family XIII bacterium]
MWIIDVEKTKRDAKITVLDGYTENPGDLSWDGLAAFGELTVYDRTDVGDEELIVRRIGDADIVITNKTPITRSVLARCPQVRYIGVIATGYNVVDIEAASSAGIVVTNIPDYCTDAVGQLAISLLLEICCRVGHHDEAVHAGRWASCPDFCFWDYPLTELSGKTMGIVGFGSIGQVTGRLARAFGMRVLATGSRETDEGRALAEYAGMDELFASSDVISLHAPLTPETDKLINADSIAKMKQGVIIINTARGGLIDERDLAAALNSGRVYAAGVDVASEEPIKADNPLLTAKNCIITPHIAWGARESRQRLMERATANVRGFLDGEPINAVNAGGSL